MIARSTFSGLGCSAALLLALEPAGAQVLPKIPPAPIPRQEFAPPPPPKPVETKPPEPDVVVPPLEIKDASGKLKIYSTSLDEVVIRSIKFPPDKQAKVDASIAARNQDLEKWAVDNLEKIKAAIDARKELDDLKDFNQFSRVKEAANALQQEGLLDRLVRDGAITTLTKSSVDRNTAAYADARSAAWSADTGANVMKIAYLVGSQGYADQTRDVLAAVDRLIARATPSMAADAKALGVAPDQIAKLQGANPDQMRSFVFDVLTPEQRKTILSKYVSKSPARDTPRH